MVHERNFLIQSELNWLCSVNQYFFSFWVLNLLHFLILMSHGEVCICKHCSLFSCGTVVAIRLMDHVLSNSMKQSFVNQREPRQKSTFALSAKVNSWILSVSQNQILLAYTIVYILYQINYQKSNFVEEKKKMQVLDLKIHFKFGFSFQILKDFKSVQLFTNLSFV